MLSSLGEWWSSLSSSTMKRFVSVWRQALCLILSDEHAPRSDGVRNLLQVLQYMYNVSIIIWNRTVMFVCFFKMIIKVLYLSSWQVNSRVSESQRLPESDFYVMIEEKFLFRELQIWRLKSKCRVRKFLSDLTWKLTGITFVKTLNN